jgi:ribosomal-protein-alanine N-acetyltransferase
LRRSTPHLLNDLLAGFFKQNAHAPPHPLVGYAGVWIGVDEAHVTTIAVALPSRRQGVGELLLNRLIDYALESGVALLTLEVRLSNSAAQQLYQKYGFQVVGERKRYYTDNGEDALIMSTEAIGSPAYQGKIKTLRHALFERLRAQVDTRRLTSGSENQAVCFP